MTASVAPFFVAPESAVQFSGWSCLVDNAWEPLPDYLDDWDYNTDIVIRAEVVTDLAAVRAATHLHVPGLALSVSARSVDGRVGSALHRAPLEDGVNVAACQLHGNDAGPEIEIFTRIVLDETVPRSQTGAAHLAGSVLWEQASRLVLSGTASRFPAVVVDFALSGLDGDASWVLEVPDDFDTPVLGGLLLLINETDTDLVAAASGRLRSKEAVVSTLLEQVAVQLLDHAVVHAETLLEGDWPTGSLGATLIALANRYEGGLTGLVSIRSSHSALYRSVLVGEARRNGVGQVSE